MHSVQLSRCGHEADHKHPDTPAAVPIGRTVDFNRARYVMRDAAGTKNKRKWNGSMEIRKQ